VMISGADDRIEYLRDGLYPIAQGKLDASSAQLRATTTLSEDEDRRDLALQTPQLLADTEERLRQAKRDAAVAARKVAEAQTLAARLPDVEGAASDLAQALAEQEQASAEAIRHRDAARAATAEADGHQVAAGRYESVSRALTAEAETLHNVSAKLKALESAEARLVELEPQAAEWRETAERLERALSVSPEPTAPGPPPDVECLVSIFKREQLKSELSRGDVTRAEERVRVAAESVDRIASIETELSSASAELSDWTRLGKDLGRDGLQAALIDSALGELTEVTNHLLHESFGPRWTVRFDTQRLDAKGKKQLEALDITVIDTEHGRDAPVETYSGGEQTILAEAISLALTAVACRRFGMSDVTLVRDESGAALDPEKASAYVAMLRRGAELIGARSVLLVSHSREVQELCDAQIILDGEASRG